MVFVWYDCIVESFAIASHANGRILSDILSSSVAGGNEPTYGPQASEGVLHKFI